MGQSVYREDASRGSRHRGTFVCGRVYSWAYDSPCVEAVGGGGPKRNQPTGILLGILPKTETKNNAQRIYLRGEADQMGCVNGCLSGWETLGARSPLEV